MPECPDPDERVLVALAQSGDRDALEALLRRYYRPLRAFIVPLVGGSHADDVLQDIALAIFQNLRYLRHPGAFRIGMILVPLPRRVGPTAAPPFSPRRRSRRRRPH